MRIPWQVALPFRVYIRSIRGLENIPKGNCIIVANHESSFDTIVLTYAFRKKITFIATRRLFQSAIRRLFVFALGQAIPDGQGAIHHASGQIARGATVCIFPQGEIHPQFLLNRYRTGAVVLSWLSQKPMVPVRIAGTGKIWPPLIWPLKFWRLKSVDLVIGKPIDPPEPKAEYPNEFFQQRINDIMKHIKTL